MNTLKQRICITFISLFVPLVTLNASLVGGGYLAIKNKSSLPVTIGLKTTLDAYYYSLEERASLPPTYDLDKTIEMKPGEVLPIDEISIPNKYPIYIRLSVGNLTIMDSYVIPANGFSKSGGESVTKDYKDPDNVYSFITGEIGWSSYSPDLSSISSALRSVPVYLNVKVSYSKSKYFRWFW